jgi:hypothetical protein
MCAKYLANTTTKEIHDLKANLKPSVRENCRLNEIKKEHKEKVYTLSGVGLKVRNDGYSGCKWCLAQYSKRRIIF